MYLAALDPMSLVRALPGNVAQGIIWGIMALGVYITFRILDFADLTVDGSLATGGAVAVMLIRGGMNPALALLFAFLAGMAAGFVTGILHTFFGIPGILASILTQIGLYSVNLGIMGKSNQAVNVMQYKLVASLRYVTGEGRELFFVKLIVAALILIAIIYWFFGTELGCSLRATGCNDRMSRAQGINTDFNRVLGLMISNGLVAFSGALLSQYQGFADVQMGRGAIVIGLAAVVIGEAVFSKIFRNFALKLLSVGIGSVIYYIVMQICIWFKIDTDLLKMLSAIVVAIFLAVPYWKAKYFTRVAVKKGGSSNA